METGRIARKRNTMNWDSIQFPSVPATPRAFTPSYLAKDYVVGGDDW